MGDRKDLDQPGNLHVRLAAHPKSDRIEALETALRFYRDQWKFHAIGDEGDGVTDMGRLDGYEAVPTNALLKDGGDIAREALSRGRISGELWT